MPVHQNTTLDSRHFIIIKPITIRPPVGIKLQAWSSTKCSARQPTNEQVMRGSYHREQQRCRQQYWRPYEEVGKPIFPQHTKLLGPLKQADERAWSEQAASDKVTIRTAVQKATGRSKSVKMEDTNALKKHLCHVRRLMSAVKQGKGYFHLLQKEEQKLQEVQLMEQRRLEEERRAECQPPCYDSDSDTESPLRTAVSTGGSWSSPVGGERRKKLPAARPFTPVHHSLTSPQLSSVALEPLFRQLCCLNWLLEAMTLNPAGRTGPVSSCWDVIDPGKSRLTAKVLNKEKAIEARWDQFISPPRARRGQPRAPCSFLGRPPLRKASVLSVASSSATTPTLRSLSSPLVGLDETPPMGGATTSEDSSPQGLSEYGLKLDTLSQNAANELHRPEKRCTDAIDSCPKKQLSAVCQFIKNKSAMLDEMRESFQERAQELALSLSDSLETKAKNRWDTGIQRLEALCNGRPPSHRPRPVTVTTRARTAPEALSRPCEDGVWLSQLLARLPDAALQDRRVGRLLEKLGRFTDGRSLKTRPPVFLRVLGGLQPWELCSPDLCVAIEIVREHVVHMSPDEYDTWLRSRVALVRPTGARGDPLRPDQRPAPRPVF